MKGTQFLLAIVLLFCAAEALKRATPRLPKWHQLEGYTFEQYLVDQNKAYADEEYELRKSLFEKSLAVVRQHNSDPSQTYKRGINHLSDWTSEEFRATLGYDKQLGRQQRSKRAKTPIVDRDDDLKGLPASVDWRDSGVISDVKDQGRCGSCWTFGAAEAIESHFAIQTGFLQDLSQQQILDCVPNTLSCGGTGGCQGGTAELVFETLVQTVGGLASEWTYPYRSYYAQNYTCAYDQLKTRPAAHLTGHVVLATNQYAAVIKALAAVGPLAVNVDASEWSSYESGVFNGCHTKNNIDINHVVQLVGYGTDAQHGDYWIVRNSWGPKYGEQGYIRISRNSTPQCGTDKTPLDGTGCVGGPATQTVCGTCGILFDVSYPKIL